MLDYDELTKKLYQENINWVYSIVKNLDEQGVERKETFIQDAYVLNDVIVLGYYFMNLYIVSNLNNILVYLINFSYANNISANILLFIAGYSKSIPEPKTATVAPCTFNAPL